MQSKISLFIGVFLFSVFVSGCSNKSVDLSSFSKDGKNIECFDRKTQSFTSVVDSHLHYRPFGGKAIPFDEVNDYLRKTGVLFVNVYGIGQSLDIHSHCTYYKNCPGVPAKPSIKNDFINAKNFLESKPEDIHMTLSMTFPDLAHPENIVEMIELYDREYPKVFTWMGEVNLIKQALIPNQHEPASLEDIENWKEFMAILEKRNIPLNIHSDLGNDEEPLKFLYLMEHVLKLYPNNKIVWAHMGLSIELQKMDPKKHIAMMKSFLDKNQNLMLDYSWDVLDKYYLTPHRELYAEFFNAYPDRLLAGTDFVAAEGKGFEDYKRELKQTSAINKDLNDEAFRNIALGENYFKLLNLDFKAPQICK